MSGAAVRLRVAGPEDATLVYRLITELSESLGTADKQVSTVEDVVRAMSADPPDFHALVAEADGEPLGFAVVFQSFSTWRGSRGVYVQDLYVADRARGRGIGRQLLGAVADWARQRGATYLRLSVDKDNDGAQTFYERAGLKWRDDEFIYEAAGARFQKLGSVE